MIVLEGIGKYFNDRPVLARVTTRVEASCITLLAGPNGAGKSTLLRIMAGLLKADEGEVEYTAHAANAGAIGYLGHQPFIYGKLTALENLRFWQKLHKLDNGDAARLAELEAVNLGAFAHERAGHFSRGMLQRLNLARLFSLRPSCILLDEPETGLDTASRELLCRRMHAAREAGAAIVWISHSADLPGIGADRLLGLARGRIVYDGAPSGYTPDRQPPGHHAEMTPAAVRHHSQKAEKPTC